jgi:hypothetical protein
MSAPELEACGWYVRTKRTAEDSAGWLIADCSSTPHGDEYARQFAATRDMLTALQEVLKTPGLQSGVQAMCAAAIAKATGRDVADVIKGG